MTRPRLGARTTGQGTPKLAVALLLACAQVLAQDDAAPDPQSELARVVDLPDADARRKAAVALSKQRHVTLEQWLEAMASFGSFEAQQSGVQRHVVSLPMLGETEDTELFVYVPEDYDPEVPAPLLLMGHGSGSSGRGQHRMWQAVAEELGMLVLSPSEASDNNGWAFTVRERHSALAALRWARRQFNVDENRIFGAGISRGGHMTWDLALRHPDLFAAIAPMIGGPRLSIAGGQNNLRYMENVTHLPIRDLQGSRDDPLLLFNLRLGFERLEELGAGDAKLFEFPELGHSFEMGAVDWVDLFASKRRDPRPPKVVRMATREDEARSFWVEILRFERNIDEDFRPRVQAAEWEGLDDGGRRELLTGQALERTARLEVAMTAPGEFTAKGSGVRSFRLLLTADMFVEGTAVQVGFNGDRNRRRVRADKEVLLVDFAERFDRTFLPVAQMVVR